ARGRHQRDAPAHVPAQEAHPRGRARDEPREHRVVLERRGERGDGGVRLGGVEGAGRRMRIVHPTSQSCRDQSRERNPNTAATRATSFPCPSITFTGTSTCPFRLPSRSRRIASTISCVTAACAVTSFFEVAR